MRCPPLLAAIPLLLANTTPLPPPVKAMLDAAIASNNDGEIATVAKYAIAAAPESKDAIEASVAAWRTAQAAKHDATVRAAGPLELWRGKVEVGGYYTTGNAQDVGLNAAIDLTRESLRWRHKLRLAADYKESAGLTSRDHVLAAYEPNVKYSPRGYVYGAAQYESDRFLGYFDRYSASFGAGVGAIRRRDMRLDVELGPAYRRTHFTDARGENSVAARGSLDFDWRLTRAMSLTQVASAYLEGGNSTVSSATALNARLIGPLSAKLSYALQYESAPPVGRVGTDTTSSAALVYSF